MAPSGRVSSLREDIASSSGYAACVFSTGRKHSGFEGARVTSRSLKGARTTGGTMTKESEAQRSPRLAKASVLSGQAFKYAREIAEADCVPCPMPDCKPLNVTALRLVHNPIISNDFLPVRRIFPTRRFSNNAGRCSGWALSMWMSEHELRNRAAGLFANRPGLRVVLGDHIATVKIAESDGLCTAPDERTHFGLFEYADAALEKSCSVIGALQ